MTRQDSSSSFPSPASPVNPGQQECVWNYLGFQETNLVAKEHSLVVVNGGSLMVMAAVGANAHRQPLTSSLAIGPPLITKYNFRFPTVYVSVDLGLSHDLTARDSRPRSSSVRSLNPRNSASTYIGSFAAATPAVAFTIQVSLLLVTPSY